YSLFTRILMDSEGLGGDEAEAARCSVLQTNYTSAPVVSGNSPRSAPPSPRPRNMQPSSRARSASPSWSTFGHVNPSYRKTVGLYRPPLRLTVTDVKFDDILYYRVSINCRQKRRLFWSGRSAVCPRTVPISCMSQNCPDQLCVPELSVARDALFLVSIAKGLRPTLGPVQVLARMWSLCRDRRILAYVPQFKDKDAQWEAPFRVTFKICKTAHGGVHVRWIPGWLPYLQTPAANCFIKLEFDYCAFTELSGAPTVYNVSLESTKIHSD
ncbi:unnamed protein product, partial [Nesidiocoris tenuis]